MTKLSVVIITKNEEHNIARCIKSCLPLHAEIIVLDSYSSDDTVDIASSLGAQVHTVDWQGYGATKNHGAELAQNEWILSLDADEALDEALLKVIPEALDKENGIAAFWIYRTFIFNEQKLMFGALKDEKRLRLYNKNKMHWNLNEVHEDLEAIDENIDWPTAAIQGSLLHYSYKDLDDMKIRLEKYAKLGAKKLQGKSKSYLLLKQLFAPTFSFLKNYIMKKGILDGGNGYLFAKEQAKYVRNKYKYALSSR